MLVFYSTLSLQDIERLTYAECEDFVDFFNKKENQRIKLDLHTSMLGARGQDKSIKQFLNLFSEEENEESTIEEAFKGVDFGE